MLDIVFYINWQAVTQKWVSHEQKSEKQCWMETIIMYIDWIADVNNELEKTWSVSTATCLCDELLETESKNHTQIIKSLKLIVHFPILVIINLCK